VGSQYLITDHGVAPEKTVAPSMLRRVRTYERTVDCRYELIFQFILVYTLFYTR
jgi:hypothetical protein